MSLIAVLTIFFLLNAASGATQVDLRLGDADFFLGEKFIINAFQRKMDNLENEDNSNTILGGSRGARLIGPKKYPTSLEERMLSSIHTDPTNYFDEETKLQNRQGRLIGIQRLPTGTEPYVLRDLSGELTNKFEDVAGGNMRQPRLIGPKKYPTQLEDHFLREVNPDVNNSFEKLAQVPY